MELSHQLTNKMYLFVCVIIWTVARIGRS
jgi:hypothetical protein